MTVTQCADSVHHNNACWQAGRPLDCSFLVGNFSVQRLVNQDITEKWDEFALHSVPSDCELLVSALVGAHLDGTLPC